MCNVRKTRKWARNIASDTSLIISFRDSCPDPTDGFHSNDPQGFWQIPTEMNKHRNAERHTHGNAEIHRSRQLILNGRKCTVQKCINAYVQTITNICEHPWTNCKNLPTSANIYEHLRNSANSNTDANMRKHRSMQMETCSSTEIHKFRYICGNVEMRKCRTA